MRDALKNLKEEESIMVLPADKGHASVVMDTDAYRAKMSTLIENGPYQLLNKDQTDRLTRKLSEKLLTLKRSGYLPEAVYNKILFLSCRNLPRLYKITHDQSTLSPEED